MIDHNFADNHILGVKLMMASKHPWKCLCLGGYRLGQISFVIFKRQLKTDTPTLTHFCWILVTSVSSQGRGQVSYGDRLIDNRVNWDGLSVLDMNCLILTLYLILFCLGAEAKTMSGYLHYHLFQCMFYFSQNISHCLLNLQHRDLAHVFKYFP